MNIDNEMRGWANLVRYERWQMNQAFSRIVSLNQERDQAEKQSDQWQARLPEWKVEANAFLESFCVHFRNLQDFLCPRGSAQEKYDVTSGPFLGEEYDYQLVSEESPIIVKYRKPLDRRLSHISKARTAVLAKEKAWPVGRMSQEMDQAWQGFLDALRDRGHGDRVAWFSNAPVAVQQIPAGVIFSTVTASTYSIGPSFAATPDFVLPTSTGSAAMEVDQGDDG